MIGALVRLSAIGFALALCVGVALFVYAALGDGFSQGRSVVGGWGEPASSTPRRETYTIQAGQSAAAIGEELQQRGLIRSSLAFRWEIDSRGLGSKLEAGDYELSPSLSNAEIVAVLARGPIIRGIGLTVPEGWRAEQVARRMEEVGLGKAEDVLRLVRTPREHGLAPPDPTATTLEGYLFPETYEFDPKANPNQAVETLVNQFERRFGESFRRQAAGRGLSLHQAVTLASIIEREAQQAPERAVISSVYHNRLAAGMRLDADPTVQYAVANLDLGKAGGYGFWKRDLTLEDLKVNSPYNTYQLTGLPPGPICSPGLASLQAAVAPADTGYLFFVARDDGSHAFATTLAEHNQNVQKVR